MRPLLIAALACLAACGPGRDPAFFRIVQFSAVGKMKLAGNHIYFM